jgi:hypothetical protein
MKPALNSTMHFEMSHLQGLQKAFWNGLSRIGTRGAVKPRRKKSGGGQQFQ